MAAATTDRDMQRQPSTQANYTGVSGQTYYKGTGVMANGVGVVPVAQGAGASNAYFLGIVDNRIDLSAGLGASQGIINVWKVGEYTVAAQGTGVSSHIGKRAYWIDNQTVGVSAATPVLLAGEIMAIPTSSTYRLRIDNAVNAPFVSGLSGFATQN